MPTMFHRALAATCLLLAAPSLVLAAAPRSSLEGDSCEATWIDYFGRGPGGPRLAYEGVFAMAVFDDGTGESLYVGGFFQSLDGVAASNIARWDGSQWHPVGGGTNGHVLSFGVFDDGSGAGPRLYVGGQFQTAGGLPASNIAVWDGSTWLPVGSGTSGENGSVNAMATFNDGSGERLAVAGDFIAAGGLPASRVAAWDGVSWSALGGGANSTVYALKTYDDGSGKGPALFMGGVFTSPVPSVARWNGTVWDSLPGGIKGNGVYTLTTFDDGSGSQLYAGGDFGYAGTVPANRVARWNGTAWSALGSGITEEGGVLVDGYGVTALASFDDGTGAGPRLYAGGRFKIAGGVPASGFAAWNGTQWSAPEAGVDDWVLSMVPMAPPLLPGPALAVGGLFLNSPASDSRLALWRGCPTPTGPDLNADGVVDGGDLAILLGYWGSDGGGFGLGDLDGSGTVDAADLGVLLGAWSV